MVLPTVCLGAVDDTFRVAMLFIKARSISIYPFRHLSRSRHFSQRLGSSLKSRFIDLISPV
ncbi:hypothetical protein K443DRAFT_682693 [Laccaria amethystina LaAM-08-1]|uniref:Uncharacterized protein n=1 Tax=Laccaria amethystina LaAM-08-1 TaxID=1095629 RepID=A0A0C9XI78_9AGAR|nr:hypothetical protein K443DRAFT_682693 [Laccaria amethystina LaAM-08-1]